MLIPILLTLAAAQSGPAIDTLRLEAPTAAEFESLQDSAHSVRLELFDITDLIGAEDSTIQTGETTRRADAAGRLASLIEAKMTLDAQQQLTRIEVGAPGSLIVEGGPKCLAFIRDFLETQRRMTAPLSITMSLIEAPHELLGQLGVEGSSMLFDDTAAYRKMLTQLMDAKDVEIVSAPQLALGLRSNASVSVLNQVSYVKDYELRIVEPAHQELLDPVIDVVEEGIVVDLVGVPMPGGTVDFNIDVNYSQLTRPIPTFKTRIGAGDAHEVEVSLPEVSKVNINALISMRPGSSALIASAAPDKTRDFIVLMHFEQLTFARSERVEALFSSMIEGAYSHRWFPPLEWEDIPALLTHTKDQAAYTSYPRSPLGDVRPPSAIAGVCALWFIEGLRQEGHCPSFAPLLVKDGTELDASPTHQRLLLAQAREAYRVWFRAYEEGSLRVDAPAPLESVHLSWF